MSVKSRTQKAKEQSKKVVLCVRTNSHNAVYAQRGSDPVTNYEQRLTWLTPAQIEDVEHLVLRCSCHKIGAPDMEVCQGNIKTVCYHSLAAIVKAAEGKGQVVTFFDSFADAVNYLRFGGKLVKVETDQSDAHCWAVTKTKNLNTKPLFAERVNMLRGAVEEGID